MDERVSRVSGQGQEAGGTSRRGFLALLAGWTGLGLSTVASAVASVRFLFPNVLDEGSPVIKIGKPDDFPRDSLTFLEESRLFVLRNETGFRALSATCTHLGCTVNVRPDRSFHCPCHGSVFDTTGKVVSGPAPEPLPWFTVGQGKDGRLFVDSRSRLGPDEYWKI